MTILTAAYRREEVFKVFLQSLPDNAYLICVGDEGENQKSFTESKVKGTYLIHENKPISNKWNYGLQFAKKLQFDHLIITGSDDIFCQDLWNYYEGLTVHYAGILDIYFMDYPTGKIKYNDGFRANRQGEPHGAGRALHRSVLQALNWNLWEDDLNEGLDASMTKALDKLNLSSEFIKVKSKGFIAMDIKTPENIHKISEYQGTWIDETERVWMYKKLGWV